MKIKNTISLFLIVMMMIVSWGCKKTDEVVSTTVPTSVNITGTVKNSSGALLSQATVTLTISGTPNTFVTGADGKFLFVVSVPNQAVGVNMTITASKSGYLTSTPTTYSIKSSQDIPLTLSLDLSTYAIVSGKILDSASAFPQKGASVFVSLPGLSVSTLTGDDGGFSLDVDLRGLDSISGTISVSEAGFKSYQKSRMLKRGANALGSILLSVDKAATTARVQGTVSDAVTSLPRAGVKVYLLSTVKDDSITTTGTGDYSFVLDLQGQSSTSGTLSFVLNGYRDTTIPFSVNVGSSFGKNIILNQKASGVGGSVGGTYANTIAFMQASTTKLSVYGVGGEETSVITYEVRDSLGFPVDINHQDTVILSLFGAPLAGGAFVTPQKIATGANGQVTFIVNSGTVSGVLQVVAKVKRKSAIPDTIKSSPTRIIISGGLPDPNHFSIATSVRNIPGLGINGLTGSLGVIVGDKYGNPVQTGTAVYFSSGIGLVTTNAGFTDETGFAGSTLISSNPRTQPGQQAGFGYVVASTIGEGGISIKDSIRELFSGPPDTIRVISQFPATNTITAGSRMDFTFKVSDVNSNPLTSGSSITLRLSPDTLGTADPSYIIPDVQSSAFTTFTYGFSTGTSTGTVAVDIVVSWRGGSYIRRAGVIVIN